MTPALLPVRCPTWTPRRPAITVDVRAYLSDVVSSPSSTRAARFDAASDLYVRAPAPTRHVWFTLAEVFDDAFEGTA